MKRTLVIVIRTMTDLNDKFERDDPSLDPLNFDTDGDNIDDGFEIANGLNPNDLNDAGLDSDEDGRTNLQEYQGLDGESPVSDSNNDGIAEINDLDTGDATAPNSTDSDGDGLNDDVEIAEGYDPANSDTDGDGLNDKFEHDDPNLDPKDFDTDNDQIDDGFEIANGLDPNNPNDAALDSDEDGKSNLEEYEGVDGKKPLVDENNDGIAEVNPEDTNDATSPSSADSDGDGIDDDEEIAQGTDPSSSDSDNDGVDDATEIANGTDPNDFDSDDDGLDDKFETDNGLANDPDNPDGAGDLDQDGDNGPGGIPW